MSRWQVGGVVLVAAVAVAVWASGPAAPADRTPEQRAATLSSELMSPYCPGRTLATCPSAAADELQDEITARLASGETESEIKDALVYRFGDTLRAEPEPRGAGLALWIVPGLLGAAMLLLLVAGSGLWRGRTRQAEPARVEADSALSARLDEELQDLG